MPRGVEADRLTAPRGFARLMTAHGVVEEALVHSVLTSSEDTDTGTAAATDTPAGCNSAAVSPACVPSR